MTYQINGYVETDHLDRHTDRDCHRLAGNETSEPCDGDVRVLVAPTTSTADAVALLRKAADWIEKVGLDVACTAPPGGPDG